jgi:uncharacterized iron-regulated membrane protein
MRTEYLRIYKAVHTWTGIVCGMALFIAFYAGALSVFKEPISRWASPPAALPAVPLTDAPQLIARTLAADPAGMRDFWIYLHDTESLPGRMAWEVRDPAADDHDDRQTRHFVASLDAGGAVEIDQVHPSPLANFIDVLHRVVGLPVDSDPNRWIMGVVSALYALALVSGVVVLLPTLAKDFFALRVGRNLKRMWLDAHNVVGIVSLPFHVVMAVTAVVFAFHDQIYVVQDRVVHEGKWSSAFQRPPEPATARRDLTTMLPPEQFVAIARDLSPGFEPASLQYQGVTTPRAVVRVWGRDDGAVMPRARGGFLALDPYSGKVLNRGFLPGGQDTPNLWISSFFALHMASFGGIEIQWMYFLLGMAGAWLFFSGNLLWIEARRRRARKDATAPVQRLDTRLMAAATVGVCLGCVIGISFMMVGSKWLHGRVDDLLSWHQTLYYTAFFASVAWAFFVGAARAAVHALWCAAAITLAIPLSSLLAWVLPGTVPFAHASPAALGGDITAFFGAVAFMLMAVATARRVRNGHTDSVWSATTPGLAELPRKGSNDVAPKVP